MTEIINTKNLIEIIREFNPLIYVGFGWFLGLLSTLVVRYLDRKRQSKDLQTTLNSELKELLPRLAGAYYLLKNRVGELNKDPITWVYSILSNFPGETQETTLENLQSHLKKDEKDLAKLTAYNRAIEINKALHLKKYSLVFFEKNITSIAILSELLRDSVIKINRNLYLINNHIERCDFYFEKSFDESMSKSNREIMNDNMENDYKIIANLCRKTADQIHKTISILK